MNALVYQQAIDHFVSSARVYCSIIEQAPQLAPHQLAEQCALALADLYRHALRLPAVEPCDEAYSSPMLTVPIAAQSALAGLGMVPRDSEDDYGFDGLHSILLSDDLSDIYLELMRGITTYDEGTDCAGRDAVWEWKVSFDLHWREHLVHALYMLDRILREHILPGELGA